MQYDAANPLIVQGDRSILVEVDNPRYAEARDALAPFAELEKSPEHIPTYRAADLAETVGRYGRVKLLKHEDKLRLVCPDRPLLEELARQPKLRDYLGER